MKKLILHFPTILIGLSVLMYSGCVLTEIDPPEIFYLEKYVNSSEQELTIVMLDVSNMNVVTSFSLKSGDEKGGLYPDLYFNGGKDPVKNYINDLMRSNIQKIELYVGDVLVKEWTPEPSGNYGVEVNNPFNHDSWIVKSVKSTESNIEGEILFTITNSDIGN